MRGFLIHKYGPSVVFTVEYPASTSVALTLSRWGKEQCPAGGRKGSGIVTAPVDVDKRFAVDAVDAPAAIAGRSLGEIAWSRLRRDKWAMTGAVVIIIILVIITILHLSFVTVALTITTLAHSWRGICGC